MKKVNLIFLFTLAIAVTVSSCKKKKIEEEDKNIIENPGPNVSENPAVLDLGNSINTDFFIRIVDENAIAVKDATIKVGNKTEVTDENGIAIITNASVPEKLAYLTAKKSGYFLGSRSVLPNPTGTNEIRITLLKMDVIAVIKSGEPATVSTPSGLTIDFKGDYVNPDGSLYNGDVQVAIKHLKPDSDDFSNQMPGSFLAQDKSNNLGIIESYGIGAIEIFSTSGIELQIAEGSKARLHMPVVSSQITNAPANIPLWHFDEVAGYWIEEGEANLVNGEYVGEVKHFSFWTGNYFSSGASIIGTIEDGFGNPIPFGMVEIVTPNISTIGQVNGMGYFRSSVPANVPITFNVFDNCGNVLTTWTNTFTVNASISHTFTISSSSFNTITGTLLDCNSNPITNGYVFLTLGNNSYFPIVNTNGQFNINVGSCTNSTVTLEGFDLGALQSSGSMTYTVTNPITNVGSILTCAAPSEYITYTIDSNPAKFFYAPISCVDTVYLDGNGTTDIEIYADGGSGGFDYISLLVEDTSLGSYNFSDYSYSQTTGLPPGAFLHIGSSGMGINYQASSAPNIVLNLNAHGPVGSYVDMTFSGTYTDYNNVNRTISATLHMLRDR